MTITDSKTGLRKSLRLAQWLLFGAGILGLSWCAFVVVEAQSFQATQNREFDRLLSSGLALRTESVENGLNSNPPVAANLPPPVPPEGMMGRIEIARLGLSVIFVEGTTAAALRHAAGHILGTAIPGQPGNVGISAHRDTFFRPLKDVQTNDVVVVTTQAGAYRYRVVSTRIVDPENVSVLDPGTGEILTLVTCYPFYFVGEAPSRFIVRAARIA